MRAANEPGADAFKQAMARVAKKDYRGGIALFEEAHRISGKAGPLFNIALAYERLGEPADLEQAYLYYHRYLAHNTSKAELRREATKAVAAIERQLAKLGRTLPKEARVDDAIAKTERPPAPPPPQPTPKVEAPPTATTQLPLAVPPPPTPAPSPVIAQQVPRAVVAPPVARPGARSSAGFRAGIAIGASGLAAVIAGGALLGIGNTVYGNAWRASSLTTRRGELALGQAEFIAGAVTAGVGAAALIAGCIMIALPRREKAAPSAWVSPSAHGVVVGGVF